MSNVRAARGVAAGLAVVLVLAACRSSGAEWTTVTSTPDGSGPTLHITGIIRYSEVEGGVYTILSADSVTYNPINLPAAYQRDGLAIEAEGRTRNDMAGIHQVGPLLEMQRIRRR